MFYRDRNSNWHYFESAPSKNKILLEKYINKLGQVQTTATEENEVISLLNAIARLARIEEKLVLEDPNGVLEAIALANFEVSKEEKESTEGDRSKKTDKSVTLEEYHYQLVVSLVNAELAVDLESALKIANEIPCKDLEGYLTARINFLNKDAKEESKKKEEVVQEIVENTFFDGASQAFFDQI